MSESAHSLQTHLAPRPVDSDEDLDCDSDHSDSSDEQENSDAYPSSDGSQFDVLDRRLATQQSNTSTVPVARIPFADSTSRLNASNSQTSRNNQSTMQSSADFLRFGIVKSDGGEFSHLYPLKSITVNDNSVYCSLKPRNVNILFKYQPDDHCTDASFMLSSILIRAPSKGFTAPCKEGLVFVSNDLIGFENLGQYDNFTLRKFKEIESSNSTRDPLIPISFFRLSASSNYSYTETLKVPIAGKYILVKLIRGESREGRRGPGNIDLQFIGFQGLMGKSAAPFGNLN